jgi:hypothetical protein
MSPGLRDPREGTPMDVVPRGSAGPPSHSEATAAEATAAAATAAAATATCAGCGAPLAPDQRYCLACGRPCSPVRLAFLDVLQAEHTAAMPILGAPQANGYQLPPEPDGLLGSLRRYSGLLGLLAVLLASLLIGLLVGHWLTGSPGTGKQVFEIKGLSGLAAAAPVASSPTSSGGSNSSSGSSGGHGSSTGSSQSHSSAKSEQAEEAKEVTTTKALPAAHKTSSSTLDKIANTTGKQHAKEVAALGDAPIETGGH